MWSKTPNLSDMAVPRSPQSYKILRPAGCRWSVNRSPVTATRKGPPRSSFTAADVGVDLPDPGMSGQRPAASMGLGAELGKPSRQRPSDRARRPPTVVTGMAARFEDESGTRGGLFAAHEVVVEDHEPPIE